MRKKAYQSVPVKRVLVSEVVQRLAAGPLFVGLDIAKAEVLAVVRDQNGKFEHPWKVRQPDEIGELIERLKELSQGRELVIAMESTGTYGDPLRQALQDAGLALQRVSGKAASDYSEVFDNVPSQHDGKDAAVIAELAALKKSAPWPCQPPSAWEGELADQVQWMDTQQQILQLWVGRLEGQLARHWPELTRHLDLTQVTLLELLGHYGGPATLAKDPEGAQKLAGWGGRFLKEEKIAAIIGLAQSTRGVRMTAEQQQMLQRMARTALSAVREVQQTKTALRQLVEQSVTLQRMSTVVGPATACVLYLTLGDPQRYSCGAAYRKGMGLNLKERSSGQDQGVLKISKRGPSLARRWLYMAALRRLQEGGVRPWYEAKKKRDGDRGQIAVVAVMRKLALAIYAVTTTGVAFDPARLFPGRPGCSKAGTTSEPHLLPGALPPDPRDLAPDSQARTGSPAVPEHAERPPVRRTSRRHKRRQPAEATGAVGD